MLLTRHGDTASVGLIVQCRAEPRKDHHGFMVSFPYEPQFETAANKELRLTVWLMLRKDASSIPL